jgi:hypothetical protein
MVRDGMLEEAAGMLAAGIPPGGCPAARSIGYRHAMEFLVGLAERHQDAAGATVTNAWETTSKEGRRWQGTRRVSGGDNSDGFGETLSRASDSAATKAAAKYSSTSASCTPAELVQFVEVTQKATRSFAKRQFTWFRGEKDGLYTWISAGGESQSELDGAVLEIFHRPGDAENARDAQDTGYASGAREATGDGVGDIATTRDMVDVPSSPSSSGGSRSFLLDSLIDTARGEVDGETAQELKRYRAVQQLVDKPTASVQIRRRVDQMAADLAGNIPRSST